MFGKLLKSDLKAQFYSIAPIFLSVFVVAIVGELFVLFSKNAIATALGGFVVAIAMLFACLVIIIAVALMFSKTVFGRAGYLTLTLPVKTSSLVWSKTLSALIWTYSIYILFFASLFLWIHQVGEKMGTDFKDMADQLFTLLWGKSIATMLSMLVYYLIWFGIIMFTVVQCIHLGITCSNITPFSKFGVIGAVVIFFVAFSIVSGITGAISNILPFGMVVCEETVTLTSNVSKTIHELGDYAYGFNFTGPILTLAAAVGLHFPITYFIENKVNIK